MSVCSKFLINTDNNIRIENSKNIREIKKAIKKATQMLTDSRNEIIHRIAILIHY